jgi:S1-C subfamily serine protease
MSPCLRVASPLAPIERATSPARPGHLVLAVGRPDAEGLQASFGGVSVVSGPWKTKTGLTVDGFIRADVAMLPGFSGGPLVDTEGRLVGMTSSHLGRGGGWPCRSARWARSSRPCWSTARSGAATSASAPRPFRCP